jgi:hypothetical protein
MSTAVSKTERVRGSQIDKQIERGKTVLRELKAVLEDLEDRRELAAAKRRNAGKPGTPLREAARELGFHHRGLARARSHRVRRSLLRGRSNWIRRNFSIEFSLELARES